MTKIQIERKVKHLKKEIMYYAKVYPNNEKIKILKIMYKHYKKLHMGTRQFYRKIT